MAGDAESAVDESNARAEAAFDSSKPIVLYVEDDGDLRSHLRDSLADRYNLFVAYDGSDGLEKARRYCPDAIVTDQMMPRMSGREFLVAIRGDAELRSIPVVFLTAQYGTEGRIESLDAGADDYLTKPFHEAELQARIANLIRSRVHDRQLAELNRRLRMQLREQMTQLAKAGELEQFLPRPVIERLLRGPDGARQSPVRRQVAVLVTELSTLAVFGERLEEPGVAAVVNEYLGAVSTICAARGGVIDGLTGGRLSVLFGALDDGTLAEAADSAVHAAFEVRDKTLQLNADARRRGLRAEQLRGIGIGSGPCMVGAFGGDALRAYTAIGAPVRTAARLHAAAPPGSVVCDATTRSLMGDAIRVRGTSGPSSIVGEAPESRYEILQIVSAVQALPDATSVDRSGRVDTDHRVFRREGEYWTIVYNGRVFRLKESKGAAYLARLLTRPHVEIHVLELAQGDKAPDPERRPISATEAGELGLRAAAMNRGSPVLDERAKAAYRQRLEDLEDQLREARNLGDTERAARAEAEKMSLGRELAAAVGLGGRNRKTAAAAERFRVNVTRTVKAVIQKIAHAHPELGRHLAASIHTGTFCSYAPDRALPDDWSVSF
jgi:class 3 adenylate cyclase